MKSKSLFLPFEDWTVEDRNSFSHLIHEMNWQADIANYAGTSAANKRKAIKKFNELKTKAQKIQEKYRRIK